MHACFGSDSHDVGAHHTFGRSEPASHVQQSEADDEEGEQETSDVHQLDDAQLASQHEARDRQQQGP